MSLIEFVLSFVRVAVGKVSPTKPTPIPSLLPTNVPTPLPTSLPTPIPSLLPTNVAHASGGISIGIDLELASASAFDTSKLARRVLTVAEHADASVRRLDDGKLELELALELELKLRFSLKEAVFKALFPIVQRHVGFAEVEVRPLGNGTCELSLDAGLAHSLTSILGPKVQFNVAASWGTLELYAETEIGAPGSRDEQYFLTTAAVRVGQDSNIYNNDPEQGHGKT